MLWLVAGVLLWSVTHLIKAVAVAPRARIVARIGDDAWRGVVSLLLVVSLALMVLGWRDATPFMAYRPPAWGELAGIVLPVLAMILFAASAMKTNLKRRLRHPQMTSVLIWSAGHLLASGDGRGLVLFGGLGVWAALEIVAINRRDGAWSKPAPASVRADVLVVLVGLALSALAVAVHLWRGIAIL